MSDEGEIQTTTRPGATTLLPPSTDIISLARHVRQMPEHRLSRRYRWSTIRWSAAVAWSPHRQWKWARLLPSEQTGQFHFTLLGCQSDVL